MKKNLITLFIVLVITSSKQAFSQTSKYIKQYTWLADSLSKVYHIPKNVILAIAIVESSSGQDKKGSLLNNHFGIVGKNNLKTTHQIKTRYKQYPNAVASFKDFCVLVSKKSFYPALRGVWDSKEWVKAISEVGYSAFPTLWVHRVSSVIHHYKLD